MVDFEKAAAHEALSVPINIFKTDGTMREGTKSTLVDAILKEAEVTPAMLASPHKPMLGCPNTR